LDSNSEPGPAFDYDSGGRTFLSMILSNVSLGTVECRGWAVFIELEGNSPGKIPAGHEHPARVLPYV